MSSSVAAALFLSLAVLLVLARVLGLVTSRLFQPLVVGEIATGVLLGPTFLPASVGARLFPAEVRPILSGLANIGVALFMFGVGREFDQGMARRLARPVVAMALFTVLVPLGLGVLTALLLVRRHQADNQVAFVAFVGVAMSITAFPVLARILDERRLTGTAIGRLALTGAAVNDMLAWIALIFVIALAGASSSPWRLLALIPYVALLILLTPVLRRLRDNPDPSFVRMVLLFAGLALSCWMTEWVGLHFIFGAFLFGLVLAPKRRDAGESEPPDFLMRLAKLTAPILLPVYFVVAGLRVDLSGFSSRDVADLLLILVVAIGGKVVGGFVGARFCGVRGRPALLMGILLNARGLTELVVLGVGLDAGLLDPRLYSSMVVMALITTAMTGPFVKLLESRGLVLAEAGNAIADPELVGRP